MLDRLDCETTIVSTGHECVELAEVRAFDVIFMDVSMRAWRAAGHPVDSRERSPEARNPIPIIAITPA